MILNGESAQRAGGCCPLNDDPQRQRARISSRVCAGLGRNFNMMDLNKSYLLDKELGFGTKFIHPQLRISYPTLPLIAMKKKCAGSYCQRNCVFSMSH